MRDISVSGLQQRKMAVAQLQYNFPMPANMARRVCYRCPRAGCNGLPAVIQITVNTNDKQANTSKELGPTAEKKFDFNECVVFDDRKQRLYQTRSDIGAETVGQDCGSDGWPKLFLMRT